MFSRADPLAGEYTITHSITSSSFPQRSQSSNNREYMKNITSRILNLALYISFCLMVGTGFIIGYRLPPGSRGGRGMSLLGMNRHEWGDVHLYISYGFIAMLIVHLCIHWKWLIKIASRNRQWRLWLGLAIGIAVVLFCLLYPTESRFQR